MNLRKLKSGSDVRGVAVGEEAVLTADVAKVLGKAFAAYVAAKTGKSVADVTIALGRDSRVSGPALLQGAVEGIVAAGASAVAVAGGSGAGFSCCIYRFAEILFHPNQNKFLGFPPIFAYPVEKIGKLLRRNFLTPV